MLGQFELTGKQVMELTPLIVGPVREVDIDLQTAIKAVGKATQGNTGSLARYGIAIDETDTKTEAFTVTLEGLGVAQGFAAESAEAEPWRVLAAQFEEIAETSRPGLLPFLQGIMPESSRHHDGLKFGGRGHRGLRQAVAGCRGPPRPVRARRRRPRPRPHQRYPDHQAT